MTTKRRRRKPRTTASESPLTLTIDLKQFLGMLLAWLIGVMTSGILPIRVTPSSQQPITILPGNNPIQIDGKKEKEPPRLEQEKEVSNPRRLTTVVVGTAEITLSTGS